MIPVNTPVLSGNEKKYLEECISSGWVSSEGPFVKKFEDQFSSYVGKKHGIAVSSGSAALDIAVRVIGLNEGDEVIVPSFTIISPVQSLVTCGLKPVLVDSEPDTWNMNTDLIEEKITSRTRAILVVHIYGLPVDMEPVLRLCKKYNLKLIEDAAEMHGQTYNGKMCGSFGNISIFSFYPNKHITCGEGGMLLTDSDEFNEKSRYYRNLCFQGERRFVHEELGWNYRMTNMQAALGVAQLENIDAVIKKKKEMGYIYQELISEEFFQKPCPQKDYAESIYWVFGLVVNDQFMQDSEFPAQVLMDRLRKFEIGSRPFFWGMHEQPVFRKMGLFNGESYPVTEKISRRGFYIPSGLALKKEDQEFVAEKLSLIIRDYG